MATSQSLNRLADDVEDVACVLRTLRDQNGGPNVATSITSAVSKLFGLSSEMQRLADALDQPRYQASLYRIRRDVQLVQHSVKYTLDVALAMVHRERDSTQWMIWGDLDHRTGSVEGLGLLERLNWYQIYIRDLLDLLDGNRSDRLTQLGERVQELLRSQEDARISGPGDSYLEYAATTPRPAIARPNPPSAITRPNIPPAITRPPPASPPRAYYETQIFSSFTNDTHPNGRPPRAPDPPHMHSPTFTSSSSQTLVSSHTSNYDYPERHWAENVFVGLEGGSTRSTFRGRDQLNVATQCLGTTSQDARYTLSSDRFIPVAEVIFVDNDSALTFYWNPDNQRARILFSAIDAQDREDLYCLPLTSLRVIRDRSVLQLCRASSRDGTLVCWAKLKFIHYERMVLFYSTFVALKRQDLRETPAELLDDPEDLHDGEEEHFGGVLRAGSMLHALRLFECPSSRAFRLEARAYRGDREEVPIWTAFLTKYVGLRDQDFFALQQDRVNVVMTRPRPEPFLFVSGYRLPQTQHGDYVLTFDSKDDAYEFISTWNRLCNSARRA